MVVLLFLFVGLAHANDYIGTEVIIIDKNISDKDALNKFPNSKVKRPIKQFAKDSVEKVDTVLIESGVVSQESFEKMDRFDRDYLFKYIKTFPVKRVLRKFPELEKDKIQIAKKMINNEF
jgi:hypothetical protein